MWLTTAPPPEKAVVMPAVKERGWVGWYLLMAENFQALNAIFSWKGTDSRVLLSEGTLYISLVMVCPASAYGSDHSKKRNKGNSNSLIP